MIRVLQEVSGLARSRVEAALSRGRGSRGAGGVSVGVVRRPPLLPLLEITPPTPPPPSRAPTHPQVGGNLFYTAQPLGVKDGVDLGSTGEVPSPPYLPHISPISPLYLPYISRISPLYLP